MDNYETVTGALDALSHEGYTIDFNIAFDPLIRPAQDPVYDASNFRITKVFRFEGETNPDDEAVVYAIESIDGKIKGVMVSAFGAYADATSNAIINKLTMHTES